MEKVFHATVSRKVVEAKGDFDVSLGNTNGGFLRWKWDGDSLTVTNDRYGIYPAYYFQNNREFIISPSLTEVLRFVKNVTFDEDALAVFLRLGWLIGDDTIFEPIKALPPGCNLAWRNGDLTIDSGGIIKSYPINISRKDAIEMYAELFQKAIIKTLPSDDLFTVPLSGGRDSRHILFALRNAKRLPEACLTLVHPPPYSNEDVRIAKMLCKALNLKHYAVEQTNSCFAAECKKNLLTGFSAYEHGWLIGVEDFIKGKWATVYDGFAGGILSAGMFLGEENLKLSREGKCDELADRILEPEGYIPAMLTRRSYRTLSRERAVAHLSKELAKHLDQPNPITSFYFWNRSRRSIALSPFRLFGNSVNIIAPYIETELFDFLSSLKPDLLSDQAFHTDTIAFAYPEYA
ncbi:MAG: hypothetical protein ACRD43_12245, partial [Pyrinomonadaceae bacterium]